MQNINKLEEQLDTAITKFSDNFHSYYPEGSAKNIDSDDLNELARLTCYALNDFKKAILAYLK